MLKINVSGGIQHLIEWNVRRWLFSPNIIINTWLYLIQGRNLHKIVDSA